MRYKKLTGIILKKTNYQEADQIVTIWTREAGKVRFIAKSVRLSKSKLAYSLQDLSLIEIEVAGNKSLPVLIGATTKNNFKNLKEDLIKSGIAFYVTELMLKMTADEHPSQNVYNLLVEFFDYLNDAEIKQEKFFPILESFTLKLLARLGFGMQEAHSSFKIPSNLSNYLDELKASSFIEAEKFDLNLELRKKIHQTINDFVEFILERNLKSEPFLVSL